MSTRGWEHAPVGLLTLDREGAVLALNRTARAWVGSVPPRRFPDLLTVGGRIFWETHLAPLLAVEGRLDEVALELRTADGVVPVLLSARADDDTVEVALSSAAQRAGYERELLRARQEAERSQVQLAALQRTAVALSQAVGVEGVAAALLQASTAWLGGEAPEVWLAGPDDRLRRQSQWGPDDAGMAPRTADLADRAVEQGGRVLVPLTDGTTRRGVLVLQPRTDPGADPLDLEALSTVGQQAGLALDRARRHEVASSVAHELQQSLLGSEVPDDARFRVSTAYRPGVEGLLVGGDWHDTFLVEPGVVALVVGDVVGRGLGAASAMGQLRSAVRAVADPGTNPGALLGRLDRFVEQVEAASMATVAYAELDLDSGMLRYACAGHPPPLLLPADGPARLLWEGRSTPLGTFGREPYRRGATLRLEPGDRLLLYTDGLVERAHRSWDDGFAALLAAAEAVRSQPQDAAVARLAATLLEDERTRDDVCLLLLRFVGRPFEHQLDADLGGLSDARRQLAAWLRAGEVDPDVVPDVVLAASEAVANAAEHGSGGRPGARVDLRARLQPDGRGREVVLEVRDAGAWREQVVQDDRGRGLALARALVDSVDITPGAPGGTGTLVVLRRHVDG